MALYPLHFHSVSAPFICVRQYNSHQKSTFSGRIGSEKKYPESLILSEQFSSWGVAFFHVRLNGSTFVLCRPWLLDCFISTVKKFFLQVSNFSVVMSALESPLPRAVLDGVHRCQNPDELFAVLEDR